MAELPEIKKISGQMNDILTGKTVAALTLLQEKCSNVSPSEFSAGIAGARVSGVHNKGKWIVVEMDNGEYILLSPGMGADILYFDAPERSAAKWQVRLDFTDGTGFTVRFWWFGRFMLVDAPGLAAEKSTKDIGMDPFDTRFTFEYFSKLASGKGGQVKAFLMDQKNIGGIGNMYMHDILFEAGIHPRRGVKTLDGAELRRLYDAIPGVLRRSEAKGAFAYEYDFLCQKGGFTLDDFLIGYKEGKPCPRCGSPVKQIKTGSTSAFICEACQPESRA